MIGWFGSHTQSYLIVYICVYSIFNIKYVLFYGWYISSLSVAFYCLLDTTMDIIFYGYNPISILFIPVKTIELF